MVYLLIVFLINMSMSAFLMGWLISLGSFVSGLLRFIGLDALGSDFYDTYRDIINLDNSIYISLVLGFIIYALINGPRVRLVEDNVRMY